MALRNTCQDLENHNAFLKNTGLAEIDNMKSENERLKKELDDQTLAFQQKIFKEKSEYESTIKNTLKQ